MTMTKANCWTKATLATNPNNQHRLAPIMTPSPQVLGCGIMLALVRLDEVLAHQRMQHAFRRFSATIDAHGGIAHDIRGDALVAELSKVSDAVGAAVAYQVTNATQNEELADDVRPAVRVGIAGQNPQGPCPLAIA